MEIMPGFTLTDIETSGARIRLRHGRGTGKLTRSVLKRTEELRGHPPVDMEGALSASAHSEVVAPRAGLGGTTSSNPLPSSRESVANWPSGAHTVEMARLREVVAVC